MINFIPQNNIYFSMKVLKFGGTSVGSAESLKIVKNIIINQTEQVIVVVSAFGGITDLLISTAEMAAKGDAAYKRALDLRARAAPFVIRPVFVPGAFAPCAV